MPSEIKAAFIAGPMYDSLYEALPEFTRATGIEVEIQFRAPHPVLNAHLAGLADVPYHLVSTHTKYAPSQRRFLAALQDEDVSDFFPKLVDMAKMDGQLFGIPRNIDAKLLHYRQDLVKDVPRTWDELRVAAAALSRDKFSGLVLTGKESGLFGIFFELAEMGGARLFPESGYPQLNNEGGRWALGTIRELYCSGAVPAEVKDWHFDEAHRYFRDGHAAMICDWPGFYASYCASDSAVRGKFGVARMPAGPRGIHRAYAGSHTLALTGRGMKAPGAREVLRFLTAPEQQLKEAQRGSVPVRRSVMQEIRRSEGERWDVLENVIANDLVIPPRLAYYPEIEEILWRTVQAAMVGEMTAEAALISMEEKIGECHRQHAS